LQQKNGWKLGGIITWRGHGLQASHTAVKLISGPEEALGHTHYVHCLA